MSEPKIHLFRELLLASPAGPGPLKEALIASAQQPWKHAIDEEISLYRGYPNSISVLLLTREESDGVDACMLTMLQDVEGLKLTNILPRKIHELGPARYNAIIDDFLEMVVAPAKKKIAIETRIGDEFLSLETVMGKEAANALKAFSKSANKLTGTSHPFDQKRWFEFLLAVDRVGAKPDLEQLFRWFVESEGWPKEAAYLLVEQYQFGTSLLAYRSNSSS